MKNSAECRTRWPRCHPLLAPSTTAAGLVVVVFSSLLIGSQERGIRSEADKKQADSTAPVEEQAQAAQLLEADQPTLTFKGHPREVQSVAFSPDGKRLASAGWDQTVKVWDATTGQETLTMKGHTGRVWSVAYRADGKRLASASGDQTVKVWDTTSGQATLTLKGHTHEVRSVALSADGKWLASGSWDQTVRVWDATSGHEVLTLRGHTNAVQGVAFSSLLKKGGRAVHVWKVACFLRLGRSLALPANVFQQAVKRGRPRN